MFTQKQNEIKLLYRVTQSDIFFWKEQQDQHSHPVVVQHPQQQEQVPIQV